MSKQEAEAYKQKLEDYRWTIRLLSKSADILERALDMLAAPTAVLAKAIPEKGAPMEMETESSLKGESEVEDADEQAVVRDDYSFDPMPVTFPEDAQDLTWSFHRVHSRFVSVFLSKNYFASEGVLQLIT